LSIWAKSDGRLGSARIREIGDSSAYKSPKATQRLLYKLGRVHPLPVPNLTRAPTASARESAPSHLIAVRGS
jgi:protoporphyrinogen oxidase